jgi:predicted nucleotidyltransferase
MRAAYFRGMDRARVIAVLRENEAELRRRGVQHAALFGSVARGEARADSDIDVMLDLDPESRVSVFDYVDIVEYVQRLFSERVDVSNRETLKPHVRPSAERDAVDVF